MRKEHKIVMSTYYKIPNTDPSRLDREDYRYSVSLDVEQMLYMMGSVFGQIEYKYRIGNERTNIVPVEEKKEEYDKLVDYSNDEFIRNGIIAVNKEGEEGFFAQDYLDIKEYETSDTGQEKVGPKATLYFMTVLANRFNCTGTVNTRENAACFCMFTYKNGEEFIGYLMAVLLQLLVACRDEGNEKAEKVIDSLNNDYDSMQQCYVGAEKILEELKYRNRRIRDNYEQNFMVNASDILTDWISKHQKTLKEESIWEFIFHRNKEYGGKANMRFANNLLWHIVQISRLILHMEHGSIKWEEKLQEKEVFNDFLCLDNLIKELEESSDNPSFDKSSWIERYIGGLSMVADEKNQCVAG